MLNIGWFSTGRDEAARQLLQAVQESIATSDIRGKISFVFSNREPGKSEESDSFFELVHSYGIPLICFSHRKFKREAKQSQENWRLEYDREVNKRIEQFAPDLCVLAGYMLIVGEELCRKYNMINLHPAPPGGPVGSWQEVIWQLIEDKAEQAGAMMHLVTPELDRGPAISYCLFSINHEPFDRYWQKGDKDMLFQLIRQHELAREFPLIISTLKALSQGSISIRDGKVVDAQGNVIQGYNLSNEIDQAISHSHSEHSEQSHTSPGSFYQESAAPFLPPRETAREPRLICFDLEGPLAPQDNAYELMKLLPHGSRIFEVISRYDDLLTLEGRQDYEPGDTLALIAPFLARHGIRERQIATMGQEAKLTSGAADLISRLKSRGWQIFCISTSYEQYALAITQRLGIPAQNVACTSFPLDQICQLLSQDDFTLLERAEWQFITLIPEVDDARIKQTLDRFYWQELLRTSSGRIINKVKPVGGKRKIEALEHFAARLGKPLSHWIAVGDSITDFKMLQTVNKAGGLAIAFNANEYALPYSTMGLASKSLDDLGIVLEAWERGRRRAVELTVKEKEKAGGKGNRAWFHWLAETKDVSRPLEIHRRIRRLVREEAAKLG